MGLHDHFERLHALLSFRHFGGEVRDFGLELFDQLLRLVLLEGELLFEGGELLSLGRELGQLGTLGGSGQGTSYRIVKSADKRVSGSALGPTKTL